MFVWNMAISFQLLFIIISSVIFIYLRANSFKYYALYNIFLIIYVLSRSDGIYDSFEGFMMRFLGHANAIVFTQIVNFLIQIVFYTFYTIFALYFLDLDRRTKKFFGRVMLFLKFISVLFLVFAVLSYILKNSDLFVSLYLYIFVPLMLLVFVLSVVKTITHSGKHKYFFLTGVFAFVGCALVALVGSFVPSLHMKNPIIFFFIGNIIETIFFSLGLAYKIKLINDEKNRIEHQVIKHKHRQQIGKLHGLLEGEEKERKRIAEELHDGIAGDLSAIKFNLAYLNLKNRNPENVGILKELTEIIDKSSLQIREISHNLSPSSITNFGLITALKNMCLKVENLYGIKIKFEFSGDSIELSKTAETHIYRIVQELINNVVNHAEATQAEVDIVHHAPCISIMIKDNGKGFELGKSYHGIGLSNVDSRIRYLNAELKKSSSEKGCQFHININIHRIPQT